MFSSCYDRKYRFGIFPESYTVGRVVAKFKFIPKLEEKQFCKPWLWINPPYGMLLPGEKLQVNMYPFYLNFHQRSNSQ